MQNRSECQICAGQDADGQSDIVYRDEYWNVRHSSETNILGYLILEPRRHFLDLSQASAAEHSSYGSVLSLMMSAIRATVECRRIYTFSLAEAVPHYHLHVIPVSSSMPRAYRGRGIMSYPTQPSADRSLVDEVCNRLRRAMKVLQPL